jgi:ubiquinone biosynthesis protein UbiJ
MISEYLHQNQGPVIRREELDEFTGAVEEIRDSADRLEAGIIQLEESKK